MKIYSGITIFLVIILLLGCGGTFKRQGQDEAKTPAFTSSGGDPLELPEDLTVVPQQYPITRKIDSASVDSGKKGNRTEQALPSGSYESYRIQLYTSKTYGPAVRELNVAREIFDQKVWLDYDVPYYKVRVGDFSNRKKAEDYLPHAKEAGYSSAWVVRVNVNIQTLDESIPTIDSLSNAKPSTEPGNDSTARPPR